MAQAISTTLSLVTLLALCSKSEAASTLKLVCRGGAAPCCAIGADICDNTHTNDCCFDEYNSCNNDGRCVNKHGCRRSQQDCCLPVSDITCLDEGKCLLGCNCCERNQQCKGLLGTCVNGTE